MFLIIINNKLNEFSKHFFSISSLEIGEDFLLCFKIRITTNAIITILSIGTTIAKANEVPSKLPLSFVSPLEGSV